VTVLLEGGMEIPLGIVNLRDSWSVALPSVTSFLSGGVSVTCRGRIEVETSPENLFTHGTLQIEVAAPINSRAGQLCGEGRTCSRRCGWVARFGLF
jgi:hypothetical protein